MTGRASKAEDVRTPVGPSAQSATGPRRPTRPGHTTPLEQSYSLLLLPHFGYKYSPSHFGFLSSPHSTISIPFHSLSLSPPGGKGRRGRRAGGGEWPARPRRPRRPSRPSCSRRSSSAPRAPPASIRSCSATRAGSPPRYVAACPPLPSPPAPPPVSSRFGAHSARIRCGVRRRARVQGAGAPVSESQVFGARDFRADFVVRLAHQFEAHYVVPRSDRV